MEAKGKVSSILPIFMTIHQCYALCYITRNVVLILTFTFSPPIVYCETNSTS